MILSHSREFIFIKVPRAAGTSTQIFFEQFCSPGDLVTRDQQGLPPPNCILEERHPHINLDDLARVYTDNQTVRKYFKFCFVRNPFSRAVSECCIGNQKFIRALKNKRLAAARKIFAEYVQAPLFLGCYPFTTYRGKLFMDFIGRYENLEADTQKICDLLLVPYKPLVRTHEGSVYRMRAKNLHIS